MQRFLYITWTFAYLNREVRFQQFPLVPFFVLDDLPYNSIPYVKLNQ